MNRSKSENVKRPARPSTTTRGIVNPDALDGLKRRAEELGLIVHARPEQTGKRRRQQKKDGGQK